MWRVFLLMLGGLLFPILPAAVACGGPVPPSRIPAGSARTTVKIELCGTIEDDLRDILRPYNVSKYVTANGQRYYLHFKDTRPVSLNDVAPPTVIVTGTLEIVGRLNIVHVETIDALANNTTFAHTLIGLDYAEAQRRATAAGYSTRVTGRDGTPFPVTQDWREDRINVWVTDGKVTSARIS